MSTLRLPTLSACLATAAFLAIACSPSPTPAPSAPSAAAPAVLGRPTALGCTDIETGECAVVAARIIATLPPERGTPFSIQIALGECADNTNCPNTLAVRQGVVLVEYLDGDNPIELSIAGPPQAPATKVVEADWSGLLTPSSARVAGPGPFVFDVGHCGLTHIVDFDGSFWIPVGAIDGTGNALINSEEGTIRLAEVDLAEYRGTLGFSMRLARWPDAKRFFVCS